MMDRAERLLETMQAVLVAADVPPPIAVKLVPLRPHPGAFDFRTWTLVLREALVAAPQLGHDEAAELTNMLAHELRHAEQYYLAARWMAAQGAPPAEIASTPPFRSAAPRRSGLQPGLQPIGNRR